MSNTYFTNGTEFIEWVEHQRRFTPKVSLDKMRFYLSLFDNPHLKFPSIHITGTNGKGSVVAYLNSVLRTAGFNVATFTSPYITCFNERIRYNDQNIEDDDLISRQMPTYEQQQEPVYEQQQQEPVYEQQKEDPVYEEQPQPPTYQNIKRNNWRSMLSNR